MYPAKRKFMVMLLFLAVLLNGRSITAKTIDGGYYSVGLSYEYMQDRQDKKILELYFNDNQSTVEYIRRSQIIRIAILCKTGCLFKVHWFKLSQHGKPIITSMMLFDGKTGGQITDTIYNMKAGQLVYGYWFVPNKVNLEEPIEVCVFNDICTLVLLEVSL